MSRDPYGSFIKMQFIRNARARAAETRSLLLLLLSQHIAYRRTHKLIKSRKSKPLSHNTFSAKAVSKKNINVTTTRGATVPPSLPRRREKDETTKKKNMVIASAPKPVKLSARKPATCFVIFHSPKEDLGFFETKKRGRERKEVIARMGARPER